MELQTKLLITYLILFMVVFAVSGLIPNNKTNIYLQVSIPVMALLAILLGIYAYLENKKKDSETVNKKHS